MEYTQRIAELLRRPTPRLEPAELESFVSAFLHRRDEFLSLIQRHGSPVYVLDKSALISRAREFISVFGAVSPRNGFFYAVKSNNCPQVAAILVGEGFGLDVSSGLELQMALECGAEAIIFSGPGKTEAELELGVKHSEFVTILLDSFGELERLRAVTGRHGTPVRAGVRLSTVESGIWRKFGIPLERLAEFLDAAERCSQVRLCGVQFHLSWNMDPDKQVMFIKRLGTALRNLPSERRRQIEFIDIGGGYWPGVGEWLQAAATPEGMLRNALQLEPGSPLEHFKNQAAPLGDFADRLGTALREHLPTDVSCEIYCEPGRWLCHDAMHILLTVADCKAPDLVITDGGTNAVGWERFESDHFPVINLTRPALVEHECLVAGSLCTPHDLWGYTYFGDDIQPGDVLLVPSQGAYTYSLRQEFIKPVPPVVILGGDADAGPDGKGPTISGSE